MASIELLQLPDELLIKILSFISERFEIASVCRKFYDLICAIDKNRYELVVNGRLYDEVSFPSIINSKRVCDRLNDLLSIKTAEDVEMQGKIFRHHGASIKKSKLNNFYQFNYSENEIIELLNYFPDLEELELSSWSSEIAKTPESEKLALKLPNLKSVFFTNCEDYIVEFISKYLPQNSIKSLKTFENQISTNCLKKLIENQTSIESINIEDAFETESLLENLKLTSLRLQIRMKIEDDENLPFRTVLKNAVKSQPNLKTLDILQDDDYSFKLVDDEIFLEICKIKSLETLKVNISGVAPACVRNFSNLTNLKNFETLTCTVEEAEEAFHELSLVKTVPMERFEIRLWKEDLPAETFQQFGLNYPTLKYLEIKLGTWHKLNFFMKSFPGLETLKIRFGEANNCVDFSEAYDDDGITHLNIKNLKLEIHGSNIIDIEMFFIMLKAFPNLEKLCICSKLVFSSEFFKKLQSSVGKIQELQLSMFSVTVNITFENDSIQVLRELSKILKAAEFILMHSGKRSCRKVGDADEEKKVDFQPLFDGLKDFYKVSKRGWRTNVLHTKATLKFGNLSEW